MSKEFCQKGYNKSDILIAARQEEHLSYLINSELEQTELTTEYLKQWAERKYQTNDYFLNFLKSIFKEENFLLFAKFLRKPLPSAKIINTKIRPQLERVFNAEDSEAKYEVRGVDDSDLMPTLKPGEFNDKLFDAYFTAHNSIVVTELSDEPNKPFRYLVNIKDVTSIEEGNNGEISKISFKSKVDIDGKKVKGWIYIDENGYQFYPFDESIPPLTAPHDLGYCPAHFITPKRYNRNFVVRESQFTFIREELEDYNILRTLLKMVMPNGVIPITKMLKVKNSSKEQSIIDPKSDELIGGQQSLVYETNPPTGSGALSAGSVYSMPPVEKADGSFDMEIIKNFILFDYLPVEPLKFLTDEIEKKEKSIISSLVGDLIESVELSKNTLQIERSNAVLDNTLTSFGKNIAYARTKSDTDLLNLKYGKDNVISVFYTCGTDFMIDSQALLLESLTKAPNAIERENILRRINQNRYKNNPYQATRAKILYDIIPFVSDKDFEKGIETNIVDELTIKLQVQFNYWISRFESIYGDIVEFYRSSNLDKGEKTTHIKDLIINIIENESSTPANKPGDLNG